MSTRYTDTDTDTHSHTGRPAAPLGTRGPRPDVAPAPASSPDTSPSVSQAPTVLTRAAGSALIVGAVTFFAGMATSPATSGDDKASYLEAAARDPFQTQISAVFLHYGNLLMGLGVLAVPLLVRGRRGTMAALVGALLAAVSLLNLSGSLFTDWFHLELGASLPPDVGAAISDRVLAYPLQQLAFGATAPLIVVGFVVAYAGLARAGVLGWWTVPAVILGYALMLFLPYSSPLLPALGTLPMLAVLVVTGLRVLQRSSLASQESRR